VWLQVKGAKAAITSAVAGVVGADEERLLLIMQWLDAHRK
jgi:hypothetical protein